MRRWAVAVLVMSCLTACGSIPVSRVSSPVTMIAFKPRPDPEEWLDECDPRFAALNRWIAANRFGWKVEEEMPKSDGAGAGGFLIVAEDLILGLGNGTGLLMTRDLGPLRHFQKPVDPQDYDFLKDRSGAGCDPDGDAKHKGARLLGLSGD